MKLNKSRMKLNKSKKKIYLKTICWATINLKN